MLFDPLKTYAYEAPTKQIKDRGDKQLVLASKSQRAKEKNRLRKLAKERRRIQYLGEKIVDDTLCCANPNCDSAAEVHLDEDVDVLIQDFRDAGWVFFKAEDIWLCGRCAAIHTKRLY